MALLAKKRGMVSTWPMPMKRSRVLTRQAMTSEKVEKIAAPSTMKSSIPARAPGESRRWAPMRTASRPTMRAWAMARTPAETALPVTRAPR